MAVQSFENLHTFLLQQPCWYAREHRPAHFSYHSITENSPTFSARNTVFVGPIDFKFDKETCFMV